MIHSSHQLEVQSAATNVTTLWLDSKCIPMCSKSMCSYVRTISKRRQIQDEHVSIVKLGKLVPGNLIEKQIPSPRARPLSVRPPASQPDPLQGDDYTHSFRINEPPLEVSHQHRTIATPNETPPLPRDTFHQSRPICHLTNLLESIVVTEVNSVGECAGMERAFEINWCSIATS